MDEAGTLLKLLADNPPEEIGGDIQVMFNMNSGYVFLADENCRVWMSDDEKTLYEFYSCPECGHEGSLEDMEHNPDNKDCQEYIEQIKA